MREAPQKALYTLLCDIFQDGHELKRHASHYLGHESVLGLPNTDVSMARMAHEFVNFVFTRGMHDVLFRSLADVRPAQRSRIAEVAVLFPPSSTAHPGPSMYASNVPEADDPSCSRDALLASIAARLGELGQSTVLVLHGPPGVGKTELTRRFARAHANRYDGALTFTFGDDKLPAGLVAFGRTHFGLKSVGDPTYEDAIAAHHELVARPLLLIYDDIPDQAALDRWPMTVGARCHLIVTTTWADWVGVRPCLHVPPLSSAQGAALVHAITDQVERTDVRDTVRRHFASRIVEHACGLPVQIVAETTRVLGYLLDNRSPDDEKLRPALAPATSASFEQTWRRLSEDARNLLGVAARLAFDSIEWPDVDDVLRVHGGFDESRFREASRLCRDHSLLTGDPLQIQRPFAEAVRERKIDDSLVQAVHRRLLTAANIVLASPRDPECVRSFRKFPLATTSWSEVISTLYGEGGSLVMSRALAELGELSLARAWALRAVAEVENNATERDKLVALADALLQAGQCEHALRHYHESIVLFERSLAVRSAMGITERRQTRLAQTWSDLGNSWIALTQVTKAYHCYEKAREATLGSEESGKHWRLGNLLISIGHCMRSFGRSSDALMSFRTAVEEFKCEGTFQGLRIGNYSKGMGDAYYEIAHLHEDYGRRREALDAAEHAVEALKRGDQAHRVSYDKIAEMHVIAGVAHSYLGDVSSARKELDLAELNCLRGDIHGIVKFECLGRIFHWRGVVCRGQGDYHGALSFFATAEEHLTKPDRFGWINHAQISSCCRDAAISRFYLGDRAAGERLLLRAVDLLEIVEPRIVNHHFTGSILWELAVIYEHKGDLRLSGQFFRRALKELAQGDRGGRVHHEMIGVCHMSIGRAHALAGRRGDAVAEFTQAVEAGRKGDLDRVVDTKEVELWERELKRLKSGLPRRKWKR